MCMQTTAKKMQNIASENSYNIVSVVYKSTEGYWKGFVHPYDVTVQANTKKDAIAKLEVSLRLYEEGLRKYAYPKHLIFPSVFDQEDREAFNKVVELRGAKCGVVDTPGLYAKTD